jgi:hypothetical protein
LEVQPGVVGEIGADGLKRIVEAAELGANDHVRGDRCDTFASTKIACCENPS